MDILADSLHCQSLTYMQRGSGRFCRGRYHSNSSETGSGREDLTSSSCEPYMGSPASDQKHRGKQN